MFAHLQNLFKEFFGNSSSKKHTIMLQSVLLLLPYTLAMVILPGTTNHVRHVQEVDNIRLVSTCKVSVDECPANLTISSPCFTFQCDSTGQLDLEPGQTDRQRNFLSTQKITGAANVSWVMNLADITPQPGFYHLGQIISGSTPAWTLDIVNENGGQIAITNRIGGISRKATMSLCRAMDINIQVNVAMDTNAQTVSWEILNAETQEVLLQYSTSDASLSPLSYIQGGLYRQVNDGVDGAPNGPTYPGLVYIGDFQVSQ